MQIVIDIPKKSYEYILKKHNIVSSDRIKLTDAICDGTPLPKGHGRLIDADKYKRNLKWNENIDNAPTIIEADKECRNDESRRACKISL